MKRMAFIIALAGLVSQGWGADKEWRSEVVFQDTTAKSFSGIIVGPGRNDDTSRLYLLTTHKTAQDSFLLIRELTFSPNGWQVIPVCTLSYIFNKYWPILPPGSMMTLANGRNDGIMRLYAISDSSLLEYTFSQGTWKGIEIFKYYEPLAGLLAAPGRDDDTIRLYCSSPSRILEITYRNNLWNIDTVNNEGYDKEEIVLGVATAKNDDTVRLYSIWSEFTYSHDGWRKTESCFCIAGGKTGCFGDGRSDSKIRYYQAALTTYDVEIVYEISFIAGRYAMDTLMEEGVDYIRPWAFMIGNGRGDGKNRVYGVNDSHFYEFSFENGEWKTIFIPLPENSQKPQKLFFNSISYAINRTHCLAIGKGRNDDTNRIYYAWPEHPYLFEFTWSEKEAIEEKPERGIVQFSVVPTVSGSSFEIFCLALRTPASLEIYNSLGQLVKKFAIPVGKNILYWDGKDKFGRTVAAGTYFCLLRTHRENKIEKITLIR